MKKASPDIAEGFDSAAMPPEHQLLHAILACDIRWAEETLKKNLDLNMPRIRGKSFLRHAGEKGDRRMCELLVAMVKFLIRRSCHVKRKDVQDAPENLRLIAETP